MLVDGAAKYGGPFRDILYGVPIGDSKLKPLWKLKQKVGKEEGRIHILVDHPQQVAAVEAFAAAAEAEAQTNNNNTTATLWTAFLKLDTGYHRAGVPCDERGVALAMTILESPYLELCGVYSHCGHTYDANVPEKLEAIAQSDVEQIQSFLNALKTQMDGRHDNKNSPWFLENLTVSVGSTPSLTHHSHSQQPQQQQHDLLSNLEIHAGNYTLYDRQQLWTGACSHTDNVAGRVLARVIGHYEDRDTLMLDAGATALTKDQTPQRGMGAIGGLEDEFECFRMSQEVTLVRPKKECSSSSSSSSSPRMFSKLPLGSTVNLLPNHSCLAAACFDKYYIVDDPTCRFLPEELVIDEWVPVKFFDVHW